MFTPMSKLSHEMKAEAKLILPEGNSALLLAASMLAKKIIAFSDPTATVKLSANSKATKPTPEMMNIMITITRKMGQFVGHRKHCELPRDTL